jgi:hypothetical protein
MWIDIIPSSDKARLQQKIDINPSPPIDFESRLIIWETSEVPRVDDLTDGVDIFVTGQIESTKK